jgi:amino acid permease
MKEAHRTHTVETFETAGTFEGSHRDEAAYHPNTDVEVVGRTKKGGSVFKAVYNMICAVAGIGILGLPYSLSLSGWGGVALLVSLGLIAAYTGVILGHCFVRDTDLESYSDLGMKAFGKCGKYAVHVAQMGTCLGTSILFLVLSGKNMNRVFNHWGTDMGVTFWIGISALAALPMCYLRTLHDIRWVTFAGMAGCMVAVVVIIVLDFIAPDDMTYHHYDHSGYQGFLQAFATITFAYGGHVIYPSIIRSMESPGQFPKAVYMSSAVILVLYIPVAVISYWQFGSHTEANILDNLPRNVASIIITFAFTAHVLFAYVLYLHPFFHVLERKLGLQEEPSRWHISIPKHEGKSDTHEKEIYGTEETIHKMDGDASAQHDMDHQNMPSLKDLEPAPEAQHDALKDDYRNRLGRLFKRLVKTILFVLLRTLIVGITMFVAMLIPFFGDLMDFIGASTQAMSIFILPCLIYVKIYRKQLSWFVITVNLVFATLGLVTGSIASVIALINIIHRASSYRIFAGT